MHREIVAARIAAGGDDLFKPGYVLKSFEYVAQQIGTSKDTVADAVHDMLVAKPPRMLRHGERKFKLALINLTIDVAPPHSPEGLQELGYVRTKLESWVAAQAAMTLQVAHDRDKRPFVKRLLEERDLWSSNKMVSDTEAAVDADHKFHTFVWDIAASSRGDAKQRYCRSILTSIVPIVRIRVGRNQRLMRQSLPNYARDTMAQHGAIVGALLREHPMDAYRAMHRHLRYAEKHR